MNTFRIRKLFLPAPPDEAFGPERPTWGQLEITVGSDTVTRNRVLGPNDARDYVVGPLSGVAEWIVDHFPYTLWDTSSPTSASDAESEFGRNVPSLADAAKWWGDNSVAQRSVDVAIWQLRHTLGVATSQLALPSLVFAPEAGRVRLVASKPPNSLDPDVSFSFGSTSSEYWLDRVELAEQLSKFVDETLQAARESEPKWASWMEKRWQTAQQKERSSAERLRLRFGDTVASRWHQLTAQQVRLADGFLSDVRHLEEHEFERVLKILEMPVGESGNWTNLAARNTTPTAAPHEQGYDLARRVRHDLGLYNEPIDNVEMLVRERGIDVETENTDLFRSMALSRGKQAKIVFKSADGLTARRVSLATALGRLLFDSRADGWAGAFSGFARIQETRRAGAFAAELLAPASVVAEKYMHKPKALAEDYGISFIAAEWRIHNVARQLEQS